MFVSFVWCADDIVSMVSVWEEEYYHGNTEHKGHKVPTQVLAERLTLRARELSVDTSRDSPFALLAKDNDVLWNLGGKPDDTVVIVARVSPVEER